MDLDDRYELASRLETQNTKLQSRMRGHFVDDVSLCGSCSRSHITRQTSSNLRQIRCLHIDKVMPHDIAECNSYRTINELSLSQMAEIAVLVESREYKGGYA